MLKSQKIRFTLSLTALLATALLAGPAMAQTKGDAHIGAKLYAENCSSCHLASGAGGVKFASGSVSADLRAPGLEKTYRHSNKLLLRAILAAHDEDNERLDQPMPAWKGRLTTAQAQDIIAYLHTLRS